MTHLQYALNEMLKQEQRQLDFAQKRDEKKEDSMDYTPIIAKSERAIKELEVAIYFVGLHNDTITSEVEDDIHYIK